MKNAALFDFQEKNSSPGARSTRAFDYSSGIVRFAPLEPP